MATTILYNQKSTYGGPYCFYTVQYTEKSRSASAVTLGITVQAQLQYPASYNGYKLTGVLTVGGTAFSIPLKGTETWSGTAVHTISRDITVAVSAGTTALSATFAVSNPSTSSSVLSTTGCSNIIISRYYTAASISAAGGKIGSKIRLTLTGKYPPEATCDITYSVAGLTGTVVSGTAATSIDWDTASIKAALLAKIPAATSAVCSFYCTTRVSGSSIGSASASCTLSTDERVSINSMTVTPVNDKQFLADRNLYVAGYSKARVQVSASAGAGSSIKSYSITGLDAEGSTADWTSPVIETDGSFTIKAIVADRRPLTAEQSRSITVLKYVKPAVTLTVERGFVENGRWTAHTSGSRLRATGAATVSLAENSAVLTLTLDGQPCGTAVSLLNGETFDQILEEEVSIDAPHEVVAYVTDSLGEKSANVKFGISTEIVNLSMMPGNKGVTLGGHPIEEGFVSEFPAKLYGGIYVDTEKGGFAPEFAATYSQQDGVVSLSRLLLDFAHPVGSYYWSSDDTDPSQIFGGTWSRITDRFVLAAGSGYKAGTTGGAASVTLSVSEMPIHSHSVSGSASSAGSHYHNIGCDYDGAGGSIYATIHKSVSSSPGHWAGRTTSDGSHTHSISASAASNGGGGAHNNMPPYVAAYCWRRTA